MTYSIVTVKFGTKYTSEFVNKLYSSIGYNSREYYKNSQYKFYCYTDDPTGLHSGIEVIPAKADPTLKGVWNKLRLFDPLMPYSGKVIYLDLDTLVQDNIFTRLENHDWDMLHVCAAPWKNNKTRYGRLSSYDVTIHSSVMTWTAPRLNNIWDHFNTGLRDYYMRKYSGGMDRFLAHEDFKFKTFKPGFVSSKKHEGNNPEAAIISYEEIDVRLEDLI